MPVTRYELATPARKRMLQSTPGEYDNASPPILSFNVSHTAIVYANASLLTSAMFIAEAPPRVISVRQVSNGAELPRSTGGLASLPGAELGDAEYFIWSAHQLRKTPSDSKAC